MTQGSRLILARHGESEWNRDNRFTGRADVELTSDGAAQMRAAGRALNAAGVRVDIAFSSVLRRCVESLRIIVEAMGHGSIPTRFDPRLNERHYGTLTGLKKMDAEALYGKDAVRRWRRDYEAVPPNSTKGSHQSAGSGAHSLKVGLSEIAQAESLRDTAERVMLSWHELIEPALQRYSTVMVIGHGNCLRALLKHLDHISDDAISDVEVNNGVPIVYELDAARQPVSKCVLESAPYQRSEIL